MRRNVKKSFWMSQEELWDLKEKAQAACLTESEFIRQRIAGYTPTQQVDDRFWQAMDIIREFADSIDKDNLFGRMQCIKKKTEIERIQQCSGRKSGKSDGVSNPRKCTECGKKFWPHASAQKVCSDECSAARRRWKQIEYKHAASERTAGSSLVTK